MTLIALATFIKLTQHWFMDSGRASEEHKKDTGITSKLPNTFFSSRQFLLSIRTFNYYGKNTAFPFALKNQFEFIIKENFGGYLRNYKTEVGVTK